MIITISLWLLLLTTNLSYFSDIKIYYVWNKNKQSEFKEFWKFCEYKNQIKKEFIS